MRADPKRRRAVKRRLSDAQMVGLELRLTDDQVNAVVAGQHADAKVKRGKATAPPPVVASPKATKRAASAATRFVAAQ